LSTNRADLYARVTKFQEAIAGRSADALAQARELYDLLLKPAQEQLAARKHLVIAPDAVLWNLPFQALRTEDDRYLIENYAVSYAPSLTALGAISKLRARPTTRATAPPTLLTFVNPALNPATEARIKSIISSPPAEQAGQAPDAQNEVDELSRLYGERRVAILVGAGASEDRLKAEAGKYHLLHLNVRGALNETAPLFSFAALSSSVESKEDGLLEVSEIFDLDLKTDLAVMSESELAWPKAGVIRSMTGLTWAWFVAGCPTTVVSRWRDERSSELMLEFHRRIKTSWRKESKARAWQAAVQQALNREEYRDPYFWAGFAMLGDAR
ncbi:MAG: CHAT domain-containing protein, partial [Blastocatellia bacterium]